MKNRSIYNSVSCDVTRGSEAFQRWQYGFLHSVLQCIIWIVCKTNARKVLKRLFALLVRRLLVNVHRYGDTMKTSSLQVVGCVSRGWMHRHFHLCCNQNHAFLSPKSLEAVKGISNVGILLCQQGHSILSTTLPSQTFFHTRVIGKEGP